MLDGTNTTDVLMIELVGSITDDGIDDVLDLLRGASDRPVRLRVADNEGGSTFAAKRLIRHLQRRTAPVFALAEGRVASAAGLIWISVPDRELALRGRVLLHLCRYSDLHMSEMTSNALRDLADQLDDLNGWAVDLVSAATGMSRDEAYQLLADDRELSRAECIAKRILYP